MTVVPSNFARKDADLYETEEFATLALVRAFPQMFGEGKEIWECAAGNHKIADVVARTGSMVLTSDIATYDRDHDFVFDFLSDEQNQLCPDAIVTNPPYGKGNRTAVRFCELALNRCDGFVAMLLTAKFDFGKTRQHLFKRNPRFMGKVALIDRISWADNGQTGTEDHAWFVWGPIAGSPYAKGLFWEGRE